MGAAVFHVLTYHCHCATTVQTIVWYTILTYQYLGWAGPCICLAFFVAGTLINKLIMSFIVPLVYRQEQKEGDFRWAAVLIVVDRPSPHTFPHC